MNIERCAELFASFPGKQMFVGFSGGADSTAALLVTDHFAKRFGFAVTAVHINHGLRGDESDREEKEAERFAAERGIAFRAFHLEGLAGSNLEARAREERLKIWQQLAAEPESAVVLGHHRDDALETLFLRLLRGSNVSGLAALRAKRNIGGVMVLRPLLAFSRAEIEVFLAQNGVTHFAEDSSNSEEIYFRNFLRNNILKRMAEKIPHFFADVSRSLEALTEDADFLEQEAQKKYQEICGKEKVPLCFWRELHPALQVRVLRLFLNVIPDRALICRFRQETAWDTNEKRLIPCGGGKYIALQGGMLWVEKEKTPPAALCWAWENTPEIRWGEYLLKREFPVSLPDGMDGNICCFDADKIPSCFQVTGRNTSDTLVPFGKTGAVSLKKLRTDRKIPADAELPVLRDENGVIYWACGIRHSACAPVTDRTGKIVLFRLELQRL